MWPSRDTDPLILCRCPVQPEHCSEQTHTLTTGAVSQHHDKHTDQRTNHQVWHVCVVSYVLVCNVIWSVCGFVNSRWLLAAMSRTSSSVKWSLPQFPRGSQTWLQRLLLMSVSPAGQSRSSGAHSDSSMHTDMEWHLYFNIRKWNQNELGFK